MYWQLPCLHSQHTPESSPPHCFSLHILYHHAPAVKLFVVLPCLYVLHLKLSAPSTSTDLDLLSCIRLSHFLFFDVQDGTYQSVFCYYFFTWNYGTLQFSIILKVCSLYQHNQSGSNGLHFRRWHDVHQASHHKIFWQKPCLHSLRTSESSTSLFLASYPLPPCTSQVKALQSKRNWKCHSTSDF